jgi:hypothetical protein
MMVVMTVIVAALHLIETLREDRVRCQMFVLRQPLAGTRMKGCRFKTDSRF